MPDPDEGAPSRTVWVGTEEEEGEEDPGFLPGVLPGILPAAASALEGRYLT